MQALDILRLSTRVFKTNKLRTSLTILGIGVGIGTILFLVSFGFGLQKVILEQITTSDALLSLDIYTESSSIIELNNENLEKIKEIPEIAEVSPITSIPAQIEIDELSSGTTINAVSSSFFKLSGIQADEGELFDSGESTKAIISSAVLKSFNILESEEAIGKIVSIKLYLSKDKEKTDGNIEEEEEVSLMSDFEIIGVIKDEYNSYLYVPSSDVSHLNLPNFSTIKIKVKNKDELENVRNQMIEMGFSVSALSDIIDEANKIFQAVQIILSLFGAVALIVSAIGMFNTMTIALLERIQEIGIMKALGASRDDIWKLFLVESVIIGFLGGISGILIGFMGGKLFNFGINKLASSLGGDAVNLFYTPKEFIIIILVFSTIVGFMTGLYPARRASKLNALDALRYK
ncbi:MAG: ABC transporter permease [Patescibacteria group bacterium]|nr:ABC transporter permease [Patescibacteria group bacterium]